MRSKNALLLAAASFFALTVATTTNAAYVCSWTDGVKYCGNELGFSDTCCIVVGLQPAAQNKVAVCISGRFYNRR